MTRIPFTVVFAVIAVPLRGSGQQPDAQALLRGAEEARRAVRSGRVEVEVGHVDHLVGPYRHLSNVQIAFDGAKRTVLVDLDELSFQTQGADKNREIHNKIQALGRDPKKVVAAGLAQLARRHVAQGYDGRRYCFYKASAGAYYQDVSQGCNYFIADPRTFGVSPLYHVIEDIGEYLSNPKATGWQVVGREAVDGRPAWHVHFEVQVGGSNPNPTFSLWVSDRSPFQIYKLDNTNLGGRYLVVSQYEGDSPLPARMNSKRYTTDGKLDFEIDVTVKSMALNVPVDATVGTMASLGVPIGETVTDQIAHKNIGAWNGVDMSPSMIVADRVYKERQAAAVAGPRLWPWVLGAALVVVAAVGYVRRRRTSLAAG
ncbi:MAG: hypothetical protein U0746_13215 [Gemmataceae bacterium]